jgi:ABC-2 type transport system permease protein
VNTTILGLELRRFVRDRASLFFIALLPAFFYLIFGAAQDYADEAAGNGNVAMFIMVAMAAYGAVSATVSIGGRAATERLQGWGRQLGLTPLSDASYVATKTALAVVVAAVPLTVVYGVAALTGARGSLAAWSISYAVLLVGAVVFALYGLCFGLRFRSEAALSAAGGSIVILGFLGNIFFPLSGTLLAIAKFTPLYGYVALARYPVTDGHILDGGTGDLVHEPLWIPVVNVLAWTLILALVATWLVRRGRRRA